MVDVSQLAKTLDLLNKIIAIGGTLAQHAVAAYSELQALTGKTREELLAMSDTTDAETEALIAEIKNRLAVPAPEPTPE